MSRTRVLCAIWKPNTHVRFRSHEIGDRCIRKEAIIAALQADGVPKDTARRLLKQGYEVEHVATRTGLPPSTVARLAKTITKKATTGDPAAPDLAGLATAVDDRLHDLGISQLGASKMGLLSRGTLTTLGKNGKIPTDSTLDKLDELLSWEPGSARAVLAGKAPTPREVPNLRRQRPPVPYYHAAAYADLAREIQLRLRELNMSKSKFATIGGPGRSTLATMGRRGHQAAPETLDKIDKFLLWEPGSAEAVLNGEAPTRLGPTPTPHPSLVPLNAVLDRQRRLLAQLTRWEQSIAQMKTEVAESINHVNVAINDIQDPRWRDALNTNGHARPSGETNGIATEHAADA